MHPVLINCSYDSIYANLISNSHCSFYIIAAISQFRHNYNCLIAPSSLSLKEADWLWNPSKDQLKKLAIGAWQDGQVRFQS